MTKEDAIKYCYEHKDEFIKDYECVSDGIRQFDCLIEIVESGTIPPSEIANYGMDY